MVEVSVLMPVYKGEIHLVETIDSILIRPLLILNLLLLMMHHLIIQKKLFYLIMTLE